MDHQAIEVGYSEGAAARPLYSFETEVCVLRCERSIWTIAYRDAVIRLRDGLGMRYLAHLLRHPGRLFLSYDIARAVTRSPSAADASERERIVEIRSELEEARAFNDLWRATSLETRLATESERMATRLGLLGSQEGGTSPAERARQSVTHAIRGVIRKIARHSPPLGHYLEATVRTGTYCRHSPDPRMPIEWRL